MRHLRAGEKGKDGHHQRPSVGPRCRLGCWDKVAVPRRGLGLKDNDNVGEVCIIPEAGMDIKRA